MVTKVFYKFPKEAKKVREKVFIHEQGFSYDHDEIDNIAIHMVIFDNNTPIAACRVFESEKSGIYVLGRLAVQKECRGKGVGSMLVESVKEYVSYIGGKSLILHSQLHAKEFYSKLGFEEYGEIEYEDNCPHIWMKIEFGNRQTCARQLK